MADLKLIALDAEDLAVVSAHVQDAIIRIGDMAYLPRVRRFVAMLNRFDWAASAEGGKRMEPLLRRRAALRFERVLSARVQTIDLHATGRMLSLLAVQYEPGERPAGTATLVFAGGGAIQLELECVEAELTDLGPAWRARKRPWHALDEGSDGDVEGAGSAG